MAKLPCVPQSRVFTLKDTRETMSYDQVRQYLMENPDIWLGAKEGKEVAMPTSNALKDVASTTKALKKIPNELPALRDALANVDRSFVLIGGEKYTKAEIKKFIADKIGDDVDEIVDIKITGSRVYGTSKKNSDLDVIVEYKGDVREDTLFDIANDEPIVINGDVTIDINPVKAEKSGTIEEQSQKERKYFDEVADEKYLSRAYHSSKADGSNPDFVKAVEELLGGKEVVMPKEEKPSAMPGNTNADIANRIRNKKQKGALSAIDFGISVTIYNGALDFMASQVDKGTKLGNAIANTIKWIDEKMAGAKWNKGAFGKYMNDTYSVTLPNGREVEVVRDDSKETAEVINGWYSELEQKILDSKEDKLPAATWAKRLKSKEDEDVWTGVRGFLESKKPSEQVSKKELRDWMKDNRVEISEVVKQEEGAMINAEWTPGAEENKGTGRIWKNRGWKVVENTSSDYSIFYPDGSQLEGSWGSRAGAFDRVRLEAPAGATKFSQYQLEGDKSNYKEVLVTLPKIGEKNKVEKIGEGEWSYTTPDGYIEYYYTEKEANEARDKKQYRTPAFKSSHFDEPNILVHLRINTRTDAQGNKVLFLEEVQSDWGQKGKKEGFSPIGDFDKSKIKIVKKDERFSVRTVYYDGKEIGNIYPQNDKDAMDKATQVARSYYDNQTAIRTPSAPFVTDTNSWTKLGLKVALREAVKQGADKLSWSTGTQQFERWGTEKIDWVKSGKGWKISIQEQFRGTAFEGMNIDKEALSESGTTITSKEDLKNAIDRTLSREKTEPERQKLTDRVWNRMQAEDRGTSLPRKEGMESFYGVPSEGKLGIVGNVVKSLSKQEPGTVEIDVDVNQRYKVVDENGDTKFNEPSKEAAEARISDDFNKNKGYKIVPIKGKQSTQYSIDITPEMRESVEKGLPLFGTKLSEKQDPVIAFLRSQRSDPNVLGLNAALWNGFLMAVEKAWVASKSAAKAFQAGINFLKEKKENLKEWEQYINPVRERLQKLEKEEAGATPPPTEGGRTTAPGGGEVRERKTVTSVKEASDISDAVKEALGGERTLYEVLPNEVSVKEANAILNAIGTDEAKSLVLNNSKSIPSAFRTTLAQVLIKQYNKEGKFKDAVDVVEGIAEIATDWGQGIQALSMFEFLTAAGQLLAAQREIDRQRAKKFKAEEPQMKKIKKALQKADEESVEAAVESVVTQTEQTPAPEATRKKEYGEKNKIVTKSLYEAAKKALKNFKLFTTPVPEELITIAAYHIEAGARSFADFSKEMIKDFGRKVKPYLKAAYKKAQEKVGGSGYSTDTEIAKHLAKDIDKDIQDIIKESGLKIREVIKQHYKEGERTKQALTDALVEKLGLDEADASVIAEKVNEVFNRIATDKKKQALKAIEKRLERRTPVRKTAEQKLIELSNLGGLDEGKFKEAYAKAMGFPELTEKDTAKINELAEKVQNAKEGMPKQRAIIDLLNYQANIKGISKIDLATGIWMASILSGPVTQAKNIFGNTYNMAALVFNVGIRNPKEIRFLLKGLSSGLGNGFAEAGTTLITGQSPIRQRADAQGILERANFGKYNPYRYYKYVMRFMMAADAFTYGGLREMRAYQLALSEAKEKYPNDNALQKAIDILAQTDEQLIAAKAEAEEEYNAAIAEINADSSLSATQKKARRASARLDKYRRVFDIIEQNRPDQLVADAHEFALKGTFNNPPEGALGVAARYMNSLIHNIPVLRFAVPFTNLITNVANESVNYSPVGFWRAAKGGSITGNMKKFTDEDRATLMTKAVLGTTAMVAAYALSAIGGDDEDEPFFQITAEGYGDFKRNKDLEATGWRPYSIKIGDKWYGYKLTPLNAVLAVVGALRDYEKYHKGKLDDTAINKIVTAAQLGISTVAETSFLSSVETFLSGILDASRGDKGQKLVDWFAKTGTAYIPFVGTNLYQQAAQMVQRSLEIPDKEYRGTYLGKMLRNIPIVRNNYQNAINGLGEELAPASPGIPYSPKEEGEYSKLWQLLADKNQTTGRPERRGASYIDIDGNQKAMNDEQFYVFSKTRAKYIRDLMMVNYDRIKDMDVEEFGKWMQSTKSSANKFANDELALRYEKGIYEENIQPYTAEASHEEDRVMYAIERGDVEEAKMAFDNYQKLSPKSMSKDRKDFFKEIVDDKIAPAGIKPADRLDFYKGVLLGKNPKIKIQEKQKDGKVKLVQKLFNEVFTAEEIAKYKAEYLEQEKIVAKKLKTLDEVLQKNYSDRTGGDAVWRRYVKQANKK